MVGTTVQVEVPDLEAPEGKRIMAVVFGGWAKSRTFHAAYCAAKMNGLHNSLLWAGIVDHDAYINEEGNLVYDADNPPKSIFGGISAIG